MLNDSKRKSPKKFFSHLKMTENTNKLIFKGREGWDSAGASAQVQGRVWAGI